MADVALVVGVPAPTTGSARGGAYAVPAITVCTPHHDSVTAAPVASSQASTCTSPLRIASILPHRSHPIGTGCPQPRSCPQALTGLPRMAYGAAHGKCARGRGRPVRTLRAHPAVDRRLAHRALRRYGTGGAARGRPSPFRRGHPGPRTAGPGRLRGPEDAARHHRRAGHHRHRPGRRGGDSTAVERGGGRLSDQAVLRRPSLRPDLGGAAPGPRHRRRGPALHRAARRRSDRGPAAPPGRAGRHPARPHPPRVRPARLPRRPPRRRRPPQGTARGGLAAVVRRRPDHRRPSVLAAPETGGDGGPAALSAHAAGRRREAGAPADPEPAR